MSMPFSAAQRPGELYQRLLTARQEQLHRLCRASFAAFCTEVLYAQGRKPARHHRHLIGELEKLARGETRRLLVCAPPGSAKTTFVSTLFAAWMLAQRDEMRLLAASHTASFAEKVSANIQRVIGTHQGLLGYALESENKGFWSTSNRGEYLAAGLTGTIRGWRADIALLDDIVKSRQEAQSEVNRESAWDFFTSDLPGRMTPSGRIVVIGTPMHEDDLLGRIQSEQGADWRIVKYRAFAEADDPLGRAPGEPLWGDDDYGYAQRLVTLHADYERQGLDYIWASEFQCEPVARGGNLFKAHLMPIIEPAMLPKIVDRVRAWDLAASPTGDYTVGLLLGRSYTAAYENSFVILDVIRFRGPPEEVRRTVKATAQSDGYGVKVWLPRDPAQAGEEQADSYINMLSGYRVETERMSGDKVTRADAAAAQANIGRISLLRAPWNAALTGELLAFPQGRHDDQVDALSLGFNKLATKSTLAQWLRL
jgi:predicted phage terminase large subunit-like protein